MTSAGNIFLYCYVGTFTTVKFLRFSDAAYESLWYKFPVGLQKYMRLIIADAQRSRAFDGYGVMDLNLMTFAKVRVDCGMEKRGTHFKHSLCIMLLSGDEERCEFLFDDQNVRRINERTPQIPIRDQ